MIRHKRSVPYVEQMQQTARIVQEINSEHHSFILKCIGYSVLAVTFIVGSLAAALGGNIDVRTPKNNRAV